MPIRHITHKKILIYIPYVIKTSESPMYQGKKPVSHYFLYLQKPKEILKHKARTLSFTLETLYFIAKKEQFIIQYNEK